MFRFCSSWAVGGHAQTQPCRNCPPKPSFGFAQPENTGRVRGSESSGSWAGFGDPRSEVGGPEVGEVRAVFMSPSPRLRQHGCAFLVDEVQTGGGCTGFRVSGVLSRQEAAGEGKSRLLVEYGSQVFKILSGAWF